jgi:hypothetical protein
VNDLIRPYFGTAYEHELAGDARASVNGIAMASPSLKGGTGMGELGLSVTAVEGVNLEVGIQGYAGVRQGATGGVRFNYSF